MSSGQFSPREFLKSRRPDRFSDSVFSEIPELDRSLLEYHLESLTNRSEELLFEDFARSLIERTVCPNLIPHTGPTGGGDSKVDSETYPVAQSLAFGWHIGSGNDSASERWAFAFSAKQDWRPKVKGDVAKLVATGRGYTKAFFVSSRFIRDKERAQVEDALREKHGIDVRIFDRTWILDKVFAGRLEELAIERLNIKTSVRRKADKGPRDTAKEQDLKEVEDRIAVALREGRRSAGLVEDCLAAAELARGMERPRIEVEGLFARVDRLAVECGTRHQQLLCAYERAWTTFWWYEDYALFCVQYSDVEIRAAGSLNAYELELWTNLLFCLQMISAQSLLDATNVNLDARAATLVAALDKLASGQECPSASLHARTLQLQVQLLLAKPDRRDEIVQRLHEVLADAEQCLGYPFMAITKIVIELGTMSGELPSYRELFEYVVQATSRRQGELSAARLLLSRGSQQLEARQPYEAIRTLGRAMGHLFKNESRSDAVCALYLCSFAYEQVGLLWAARGTMLAGASIATQTFWSRENVTPQQAVCYNRLKWLELRLGRLGHLLAWHELDIILRHLLNERGYGMSRLKNADEVFDPIVGMLFLRADVWDLRALSSLPDQLERLGLYFASVALYYALGHEDKVPAALTQDDVSASARREFFAKWRDQPAAKDLPSGLRLNTARTITLESRIAGCHFNVDCHNAAPCVELAESLLACIEALLATAPVDGVMAHEPVFQVKIQLSDFAEEPFLYETGDNRGKPYVELRCRAFQPHKLSPDEQAKLKGRLFEVVAHVIARAFLMQEPKSLLTKLFRDDLAPQRALDFTTSFVVMGNVLGNEPRTEIIAWTSKTAPQYPLLREVEWDNDDKGRADPSETSVPLKPAPPGSKPPPEMRDMREVSHDAIRTISLIRPPLWDKASWSGTMFLTSPDPSITPILALLFRNPAAAGTIFSDWRAELGSIDTTNKLRVAIIRNISKTNPHWYRIALGTEPTAKAGEANISYFAVLGRVHTMTPETGENVERFLAAFAVSKKYLLTHARIDGRRAKVAFKDGFEKHQLVVRYAWEIGPDEIDAMAILPDDDPIIPQGVDNPPVVETLRRARSR